MKISIKHAKNRDVKLFCIVIFGIIFTVYFVDLILPYIFCPFNMITGIACPMCGLGHAWEALIKCDLALAVELHPVVIFGILAAGFFVIKIFMRTAWKREVVLVASRGEKYSTCGLFVLVAAWHWIRILTA